VIPDRLYQPAARAGTAAATWSHRLLTRLSGVLTAQYGGCAVYPRHTERVIPVFRLHPSDQGSG
jgi:hypothetical protein